MMQRMLPVLSGLLLISQIAICQPRFNFITGFNISSFSNDLLSDYGFDDFRTAYIMAGGSATSEAKNGVRAGFYIGAESDFYLSEKTFLRSGIKYLSIGDDFYFKTNDVEYEGQYGTTSDAKYNLRPRLDYFALPVSIGTDATDAISLYIGIAPHLNINNVLRRNSFEIKSNDEVKEKWDAEDNPVEARSVAIFMNTGVSWYVRDVANTMFDFRVNYAVNTIYDDPQLNESSDIGAARAFSFEFGIGYYFRRR